MASPKKTAKSRTAQTPATTAIPRQNPSEKRQRATTSETPIWDTVVARLGDPLRT